MSLEFRSGISLTNPACAAIQRHADAMLPWLKKKLALLDVPFYSSVDIRCNQYKLAPVDTNLFPAGFNNFSVHSMLHASDLIPFSNKKVLILTENFERNHYYHQNLFNLAKIIANRGNDVRLANHELTEPNTIALGAQQLTLFPLTKTVSLLKTTDGFEPEIIILNNDLMNGIPSILNNISQPVLPGIQYGWHNRSKHTHHTNYEAIILEFCKQFDLDPWLLSTKFDVCENVEFRSKTNIDTLAHKVDQLIEQISCKYQEYQIKEYQPCVFIKSDHGTYGMGIMVAHCGEDVINASKKERQKMYITKGNRSITRAYIQEGIPTEGSFENSCSEPISYNIQNNQATVILRYHDKKNNCSNLNSPGAKFIDALSMYQEDERKTIEIISQLCIIAAAKEALAW